MDHLAGHLRVRGGRVLAALLAVRYAVPLGTLPGAPLTMPLAPPPGALLATWAFQKSRIQTAFSDAEVLPDCDFATRHLRVS